MKRLLILGLLFLSACASTSRIQTTNRALTGFRLEAHRGISNRYPENTIPAFKAAAAVPYYAGMETDVQMTSDGVLVLMHDNTLNRTTNATGKVSDYTWKELSRIRIDGGYGWSPEWTGKLRIPTFKEYLKICKKASLIPYVELKLLTDEGIAKTIETLHKEGFRDEDFVLTSFNLHYLEVAGTLCNAKREYMKGYFTPEDLDKIEDRTLVIRPSSVRLTEETVSKCRELGLSMETFGLPVGDAELLKRLRGWGIEGVTCNDWIDLELEETPLYSSCKPYTRWWWFSSEIDKNDVRDQLVWLKDHEFGGAEIAWIYPMFLDSAKAHPDFLSKEWSEPVVYAKKVADSLGLGLDFTYGSLWPFSDVNLPAGDGTRNYFDSVEIAKRPYTWDHPATARILNHLDKNAFFRYADRMNAGLSEAYKGSKSGLFVDSWEVETEYLWTPGFGDTFLLEHGYDIEPFMKEKTLMDKENANIFYDYMSTLSGYVMREFYGPFAENARKTGTFSRAQCGGAPTDLLTAFTLVDIPESETILYEPHFSKIAASAATLSKKEAVTAETFTCLYGWTSLRYKNGHGQSPHQGKEQFADLKLVCDALLANGVNQIIWHGFPFNKVGHTDNWFYTTCQVSTAEKDNLSGENLSRFNRYMTTVSEYMRRGRNYSDLAVYLPLEDSWMGGAYPKEVNEKMPWVWGQYELRYIDTPSSEKGRMPLWVNGHFLSKATYQDGKLFCGDAEFNSLYVDVEYMDKDALSSIVRLAGEGLPVLITRLPNEPGRVKHPEYQELLSKLKTLPTVFSDASSLPGKPLLEGDNLPDFWCREDEGTIFVFIANPLSDTISYPLEYKYAFQDTGSERMVTINHHGKSEPFTLRFAPMESLMLRIDSEGITQIDLGYIPPKDL